ncbi:MAG: MFS transporter [Tissierellia bacterium]|nr:MFS transporter [Tissierellia bacterium]
MISFVSGTMISGFSKAPMVFAIGRVFIGIGYFSLSGNCLSYLSEFVPYESRGKVSGILRIAFGIAILFSPLYATVLISKFNSLASVYLPLGVIGIITMLLMLKLPETQRNDDIKIETKELVALLKKNTHFKALLIAFLFLATPLLLMSFLGIYLANIHGFNQLSIGYAYTIIALGTMLGVVIAFFFTDRIGKEKLAKLSYGIVFATLVLLIFLNNPYIIIGFMIFMSMGLDAGWTAYQTLLSEMEPEKRGIYMSLLYMVNAVAVTIYSLLGPAIYDLGGYKSLVIVSLVTNFIALKMLVSMSLENIIYSRNKPSK